jgi:predicted ATPase/DNA-binding XRE family transcriptional regulator
MSYSGLETFGSLLRAYRLAAGLSQDTLADRARISAQCVSALERRTRRAPYRPTVENIAAALGLTCPERDRLMALAQADRQWRCSQNGIARPLATLCDEAPHRVASFVGRADEVRALLRLVERHRLVTITGTGGIGKTSVAVEVASRIARHFADGVRFVDLASLADPSLVAPSIAAAFEIQEASEMTPAAVAARIAGKRALIVLDTCERVSGSVAEVAHVLLGATRFLRILATSRHMLGTSAESSFRLSPLTMPPLGPINAVEAGAFDAVSLFANRAALVDGDFRMTDENAPLVAGIVRRLDGVPLAIELSAAHLGSLNLSALSEELYARLHGVDRGQSIVASRHDTLADSFDWSYELLTPREQRFLRRLATFAEGCTLEAATAVCGEEDEDEVDIVRILKSLVEKSLVITTVQACVLRYGLLDSTRVLALEKPAEYGERHSASRQQGLGVDARSADAELALVIEPQVPGLERTRDHVRSGSG